MRKYPDKIKVGGLTYQIKPRDAYCIDGDEYSAQCRISSLEIHLATKAADGKDVAVDILQERLWHEIVHAISDTWMLKLDEKQTDGVAQGILQVLKDLGFNIIE